MKNILYYTVSQIYEFRKAEVPDDEEKLTEMAGLLQKYNVSLLQYKRSLAATM